MIQPQYAQPYSQGTPSANAVNIQIFEPKAYASPQPAVQPNYTNQLYNYPQASLYGQPQPMPYPMMPAYPGMPQQVPMMPAYPAAPMVQYPGYVEQPQVYTVPPQVVSPQPQQMPAPAIEQQPQQQQAAQPQVQPQVQPQQPEAVQPQTQPVDIQQPQQPAQTVDIAKLTADLQNPDYTVQEKAITDIANYSQGDPALAQQVLNEQVMGGLANLVSVNSTQLPGPTPEQTAVLQKAARGEALTPQETQLAQQLSPKMAADKNKIISMFTLAMLQKNQRDELDAYIASQGGANNIAPIPMNGLIGFNEIQNAISNDINPEVRLAGIQAISYVARPEDAQLVQNTLQAALSDPEPVIQAAAAEVLSKFGINPAPAQAAPAQQAA